MNQKQMQYFVTVYETQNIQAAADQLFMLIVPLSSQYAWQDNQFQ